MEPLTLALSFTRYQIKGALTQSNIHHSSVKLPSTAPPGISQSLGDFYHNQPAAAAAHLLTQGHISEVPHQQISLFNGHRKDPIHD